MTKKVRVDKFITAVPGEWKFDDQVAKRFDDHVRKSIPLYEEVQRMVVEMSEWFIRDNSTVYDIGFSTGETICLLQKEHKRKKNVKFIGIDNSSSMISIAKSKCNSKNAVFIKKDLGDIEKFSSADLITSLYTIQFLPIRQREKLLRRIYDGLSEGGAFIMVEKICAENSFLEDMWLELYWDFKRRQGLTDKMILQKARSLRGILFPLTLTKNIELLNLVGFTDIDVFMKWYNFAGIIAFKSKIKNQETKKPKTVSQKIKLQ